MVADWKSLSPSRKTGLSFLMIAFFAIQAGFDLAHSVTAFPFVHYGMFSERFREPDSVRSFQVVADGHPLRAADFSIYRWDMIQQPLEAMDKLIRTRDFSGDKARMKAALPDLYHLVSSNLDNSQDVADRFPDWYRRYLGRLLGRPVHILDVNINWYRWDGNHLILAGTADWTNRP